MTKYVSFPRSRARVCIDIKGCAPAVAHMTASYKFMEYMQQKLHKKCESCTSRCTYSSKNHGFGAVFAVFKNMCNGWCTLFSDHFWFDFKKYFGASKSYWNHQIFVEQFHFCYLFVVEVWRRIANWNQIKTAAKMLEICIFAL